MAKDPSSGSDGNDMELPRVITARGQTSPPSDSPNAVQTSKYTPLTFVPLNIAEQLSRRANAYFFAMSLLMLLGEHSCLWLPSIKAWSTIGLLAAMMLFSAAVAARDDYKRHVRDDYMNSQPCQVLGPRESRHNLKWKDLSPGMRVQLPAGAEAPADLLISYAHSDGQALDVVPISTRNLDGESDQKQRTVCRDVQLNCLLQVCPPTADIFKLDGAVQASSEEKPFCADNCVLRGCSVHCLIEGIVLFVGAETKIELNAEPPRTKSTRIDEVINRVMFLAVALQAGMALLTVLGMNLNMVLPFAAPYLAEVDEKQLCLPKSLAYFVTYFVLYSNLVPISLYSSLELMNLFFAGYVRLDHQLVAADESAAPHQVNICSDLGQVEYVFSDKTGTLTQNLMEVHHFSAGSARAAAPREARQRATDPAALPFFFVLALNHTAKFIDGCWCAPSPEEEAFLRLCQAAGFVLEREAGGAFSVACPDGLVRRFQVLVTLPFDSVRKCMTVMVEQEGVPGALVLVKGADTALLPRERPGRRLAGAIPARQLQAAVNSAATDGLRALVAAFRPVDSSTASGWQLDHASASCATPSRKQELLDQLASDMECDLDMVGCVALDDLLQEAVPEVVRSLRSAEIKAWILTGDNPLTAEAIARKAGFLDRHVHVERFIVATDDAKLKRTETVPEALIVSGPFLQHVKQSTKLHDLFVQLASGAEVVVAARVAPLQKAEIVGMIQQARGAVALAIGDGANDCPMLTAANVSIGISGREGKQAANSADFAVGAFRPLHLLLLQHGQLAYRRCCKVILFSFWRNSVQEAMMALYVLHSNYSGTPLFADDLRICFNAVCSIHILAVGIFEREVSTAELVRGFAFGRRGLGLDASLMAQELAHATMTALWSYGIIYASADALSWQAGGDYYAVNVLAFTTLVIACALRVATQTVRWDVPIMAAQVAAMLFYLAYLCFYTRAGTLASGAMHRAFSPVALRVLWTSVYVHLTIEYFIAILPQLVAFARSKIRGSSEQPLCRRRSSLSTALAIPEQEGCQELLSSGTNSSSSSLVADIAQQRQRTYSFKRSVKNVELFALLGLLLGCLMMPGAWYAPDCAVGAEAAGGRRNISFKHDVVHAAFVAEPLFMNDNGMLQSSLWAEGGAPFNNAFILQLPGRQCTIEPHQPANKSWARPAAFQRVIVPMGKVDCNGSITELAVTARHNVTEALFNITGTTTVTWHLELCYNPTARASQALVLLVGCCAAFVLMTVNFATASCADPDTLHV